jgi:predicted Abi (CAAX) family protease
MFQSQPFRLLTQRYRRTWRRFSLGLLALALVLLAFIQQAPAAKISNYELAQAAPFNQVESYPIQPIPSSPNFRPNGGWIGRLILPSEQEYADNPGDWAWFEVWHAADGSNDLLGQTIKLTWQPSPENEAYLETVTPRHHLQPAGEKLSRKRQHCASATGWTQASRASAISGWGSP